MRFYQVIAIPLCITDTGCTVQSTLSFHAKICSRRTTAAITTILRRPCRPTVWSSLPGPVSSLLHSVIGGLPQTGGHQSDLPPGRETSRDPAVRSSAISPATPRYCTPSLLPRISLNPRTHLSCTTSLRLVMSYLQAGASPWKHPTISYKVLIVDRNFKQFTKCYPTSHLVSSQIVNILTFYSNFGCYQICFNFWLSVCSHLCFISGERTVEPIGNWNITISKAGLLQSEEL